MAFSNFVTGFCTFIVPFILEWFICFHCQVPQSTEGPLVQKDLILTRQLSLVTLLEIHSRIPPALHLTSLSSLWQLSHLCLLPFSSLTVAYSSRSFREGMTGNTPGSGACYRSLAFSGKSVLVTFRFERSIRNNRRMSLIKFQFLKFNQKFVRHLVS